MLHDAQDVAVEENASGWIFDEAVRTLRRYYGAGLDTLRIERLVVGVFVTAVKLSNGCGGVAYTPPEIIEHAGRRVLHDYATSIRGMTAAAVAQGGDIGPFSPVIRLATLNALSVPILDERSRGCPSDDLAVYRPLVVGRRVCMVGAMIPLIDRLAELSPKAILVADKKYETLEEVKKATVVPLDELPATLAGCDTAILTGATIPNGSITGLLDMMSPRTAVVVTGPTGGFVPEPLFGRGVALVGTTLVTDADRTVDILSEGGGMYHLFDGCLRKISLPNTPRLRELGVLSASV